MKELILKNNTIEIYALDDKKPHECYEVNGIEVKSDDLEKKLMLFLIARLKEVSEYESDLEKQTALNYAIDNLLIAYKFILKGTEKNV
jgi:hypothetical protein